MHITFKHVFLFSKGSISTRTREPSSPKVRAGLHLREPRRVRVGFQHVQVSGPIKIVQNSFRTSLLPPTKICHYYHVKNIILQA